jgi:hypothetical protein
LLTAPAFTVANLTKGAPGAAPEAFVRAFLLLLHELIHVRQYDQLGIDTFVANYFLETLMFGYGDDSFESEAYMLGETLWIRLGYAATPAPPPPPPPPPPDLSRLCRSKPWMPQCP